MSKNIRNLICLILTLGLIFSLAACGSAGSTESNSSSAPSEETGSQAAAADDKTLSEAWRLPVNSLRMRGRRLFCFKTYNL